MLSGPREPGGRSGAALRPRVGVVGLMSFLALIAAACGGNGSSTSASSGGSGQAHSLQSKAREYGAEATASQARPIEAAFHAYLGAVAAGEWGKACSHLTATAQRRKANNAKFLGANSASCAANLQATTETLTSSQRASLAKAEASAVRVQGEDAYVLYKAAGAEAAMLARREAGAWKLGGSLPNFTTSKHSTNNDHSKGGEGK